MYGNRRIPSPLAALTLLVVCSPVTAGGPNPQAPPETEQYSFMVGKWDCTTRFMMPDGSGYVEGRARWTGHYILDGWAIQDHWIGYKPDGQESHGTNIRSFNPKTRKWDNRWLSAGSLQWAYLESKMVGDTMVMTGSGKTWIEGVGFIEARRAQD